MTKLNIYSFKSFSILIISCTLLASFLFTPTLAKAQTGSSANIESFLQDFGNKLDTLLKGESSRNSWEPADDSNTWQGGYSIDDVASVTILESNSPSSDFRTMVVILNNGKEHRVTYNTSSIFGNNTLEQNLANTGYTGDASALREMAQYKRPETTITGKLSSGGVECQQFTLNNGEKISIVGKISGISEDDQVTLQGEWQDTSFCMQGRTFRVREVVDSPSPGIDWSSRCQLPPGSEYDPPLNYMMDESSQNPEVSYMSPRPDHESGDFQRAVYENVAEAYLKFMKNYPDSELYSIAQCRYNYLMGNEDSFQVSPTSGEAPLTVSIESAPQDVLNKIKNCEYSSGSYGASGNGLTIDWGDGTTEPRDSFAVGVRGQSCTSAVESHTYENSGTYIINIDSWRLSGCNELDSSANTGSCDGSVTDWEASKVIEVSGEDKNFSLDVEQKGTKVTANVSFGDAGCGAYRIEWGDGTEYLSRSSMYLCKYNSKKDDSVTHTYNKAGTYDIILTYRGGKKERDRQTINIEKGSESQGCEAEFQETPGPKEGETCTLGSSLMSCGKDPSYTRLIGNGCKAERLRDLGWTYVQGQGYYLRDISRVTVTRVDPIPDAIDDEYNQYKVYLKNGTVHEFKLSGMLPRGDVKARIRDTGYLGIVDKLLDMAEEVSGDDSEDDDDDEGMVRTIMKEFRSWIDRMLELF